MGRSSLLVQVVRASQKAARDAERARIANARAQARYQAQESRENKRAWVEEMQDEAESMTEELLAQLDEIDDILEATLKTDDYFELEALRKNIAHPAFTSKYSKQEDKPEQAELPVAPVEKSPTALKIFSAVMPEASRRKSLEKAKARHLEILKTWNLKFTEIEKQNLDLIKNWNKREQKRLEKLKTDEVNYKAECLAREIEIQKANAELDALITGLPKGKKDAVETYSELVLGESEYPDGLKPENEITYDELNRELTILLQIAHPSAISDVASYRFQKSSGEILEKKQIQKDTRARYERYVCNSVLRTIHELLEADRSEVIRLISVTAYIDHISKSTGKTTQTNLVEVATDRQTFLAINLKNVEALETLNYLGAAVSKKMMDLAPVQAGTSVRKA